MDNKCYIIVLWNDGTPYFYQNNNKVAWCFEHGVKPYKKLGCAINAIKKLTKKYKFDCINVYHILYSTSFSSSDFKQKKFEKNIVHTVNFW